MKPDVRYVRNGDVALAYQVVGDAPLDLLLVSGFLSNLEYAWEYPSLSRFLRRLGEFSRLILLDRRGSGLFSASPAGSAKEDYPWGWEPQRWEEWLASTRDGWGTRAWVVRNARWMGPSMLADPDELERWMAYTRVSASPSSAEAVMRNTKDTDIRTVLPTVRTPTLVLHRTGDQVETVEAGRYVASRMPNATFVELPGDDGIPWLGDTDRLVGEIERFLAGTRSPLPSDRRLATVMFTDIVGSTERAATLGDRRWRDLLRAHHERVRAQLGEHRGTEVDTAEDGFFATFDGPARAVRCAQAIAGSVRELGLEVRAGVHTGEVEVVGDDVRGIAVHVGARIAAMAEAGEVLVSNTVKDLVAGSGLVFEDRGEHELKGVPDRWHLYAAAGTASSS